MWDKKNEIQEVRAFLGKGAEFAGKLIFNGAVRIDGDFKGEIHGQGLLIIGEGGQVTADIAVDRVNIGGYVQGNINVKEKITIQSTGEFHGEVRTPVFIMEEGARFDGKSYMSDIIKEIKTVFEAV